MKKYSFFALMCTMVITMNACVRQGLDYKVTVLQKSDNLNAGLVKGFIAEDLYTVKTESGDTVQAFIEEKLILNNKLPFTATMWKSPDGRYGFVSTENDATKK